MVRFSAVLMWRLNGYRVCRPQQSVITA